MKSGKLNHLITDGPVRALREKQIDIASMAASRNTGDHGQ